MVQEHLLKLKSYLKPQVEDSPSEKILPLEKYIYIFFLKLQLLK